MKEIYEDLMKEEPDFDNEKEYKKWEKKLHNSVGWTEPLIKDSVFIEQNKSGGQPKIVSTPLGEEEVVFDVTTSRGGFTCETQESAEILSLLVQMNERLKRIEKKIK